MLSSLHRSALTIPVVFSHKINNNILINLINNALYTSYPRNHTKTRIISKNIYFVALYPLPRHYTAGWPLSQHGSSLGSLSVDILAEGGLFFRVGKDIFDPVGGLAGEFIAGRSVFADMAGFVAVGFHFGLVVLFFLIALSDLVKGLLLAVT